MHEALDDPNVYKVVCIKSAQVGWTDGVLNNFIGRKIDIDPCPIIVMFAKELAAKEYNDEKFVPMVEATPRLGEKVPIAKTRSSANRATYKSFPGGFLKLVGSNSPSSVKSTPAPIVCVEEPDDCNENVKDQGDTITLLEERTKSFPRRKVVFGGTPTVSGTSRIEQAYKLSDQRKFYVPCHHCDEANTLEWENVKFATGDMTHEIFGKYLPETAQYACPSCGGLWNDSQKNQNVRKGFWKATAGFYGVAGFAINEICSPFPGSRLNKLVEKFLVATHALRMGDDTKMRSFVNNTLGQSYSYKSDIPDIEALKERAEERPSMVIPSGAYVVTMGVDVQHDRLAVSIYGWGRGEESWLIWWGEIYGQTIVPEKGAWEELDRIIDKPIPHDFGNELKIAATSIDSGDGQTSDAVYTFVRKRMKKNVIAIKGSSVHDKEIFTPPRLSVDIGKKQKAQKYGVRPFSVGTQIAKDLILGQDSGAGRLKLLGSGAGRIHWFESVRPDWYEQMTSEVKVPHKTVKNLRVWVKKQGVRNEALDTCVYALHAARSIKVNLWKEDRWKALEDSLKKAVMLPPPVEIEPENEVTQEKVKPATAGFSTSKTSFSATNW